MSSYNKELNNDTCNKIFILFSKIKKNEDKYMRLTEQGTTYKVYIKFSDTSLLNK